MQTDDIFYQIFQSFPSLFFQLIDQVEGDIDNYQFKSVSVKQTKLTMDGIFFPSDTQPQDPIYFMEVQFQPDPELYYRLMGEIHLYLRQYQPKRPWRAVVFFPRAGIDLGIPVEYAALDGLVIERIYLDRLRGVEPLPPSLGLVKLIIEPPARAETAARQLIMQTREQIVDNQFQRKLLELIQTVLVYKYPERSRREIEAMFGLSELKQTRVYQEAKEEGKLEGKIEGKLEGKIEGKLEGKLEGSLSIITRLLTRRLGSLTPTIQDQLQSLSVDQLEALGVDLLDFSTESDLIQWLDQ